MLWYSAFSLPWPMYSLVAMLNCVTALPLARLRISGSRVRRPVKRTLFTVRVLLLGRRRFGRRPCVQLRPFPRPIGGTTRRVWADAQVGMLGGRGEAPAPAVGPSCRRTSG